MQSLAIRFRHVGNYVYIDGMRFGDAAYHPIEAPTQEGWSRRRLFFRYEQYY